MVMADWRAEDQLTALFEREYKRQSDTKRRFFFLPLTFFPPQTPFQSYTHDELPLSSRQQPRRSLARLPAAAANVRLHPFPRPSRQP